MSHVSKDGAGKDIAGCHRLIVPHALLPGFGFRQTLGLMIATREERHSVIIAACGNKKFRMGIGCMSKVPLGMIGRTHQRPALYEVEAL